MEQPIFFGKYTLLRKLAEGGMAEIYLALQSNLAAVDKLLVIKRILSAHNNNEEFIEMFLEEARIVASLSHPNIVQLFEVGEFEGLYYLAMEYVHGEDLRSFCRKLAKIRRPLPLAYAISIISACCAGLHYAHTRTDIEGNQLNIVHRDVSPQNILISYEGHVKVLDFGIAKAAGRNQETRTGVLKGKISYMSPEQVQGNVLDARSDVFALGIMLYELTTGKRLYKYDSDFETMRYIREEAPTPPTALIPSYPLRLQEIVLKSLTKKPSERYESAQALQRDLESFARQLSLDLSALSLGVFMKEIFADKLAEEAEATALGKPLHQIIAERRGIDVLRSQSAVSLMLPSRAPSFPEQTPSSLAHAELRSQTITPPHTNSRFPYLAMSAAALLLGIGGFWLWQYFSTPDTPATLAAAPVSTPVVSLPTSAQTKWVQITIGSDPSGAEVWEKGEKKGTTPLTLTAPTNSTLYLRLRHEKFQEEVQTFAVGDRSEQVFVLFDQPLKPVIASPNKPVVTPTEPTVTPQTTNPKRKRFVDPFEDE